jgi:hypothetical protein
MQERAPNPGEPEHSTTPSNPNFTLPKRDAVSEGNWTEYESRGYRPLVEGAVSDKGLTHMIDSAQHFYGTENVVTGDAYDLEAGRPLHHKPGRSIYVSPEGIEYAKERNEAILEQLHGTQSKDSPTPEAGPGLS